MTTRFDIEVSNIHLKTLARWASVQRTITEASILLQNLLSTLPEGSDQEELVHHIIDELLQIGPALDSLHKSVQPKIWEMEKS